MWGRIQSIVAILTFLMTQSCPIANGSAKPSSTSEWSTQDRDKLIQRLQNLLNAEELVIKNHKADLADIQKISRDFQYFRVFERIPFQRDLEGLKATLQNTARNHQLQLIQWSLSEYSKPGDHIPKQVFTHAPPFRMSAQQLAETIYFKVRMRGSEANIETWTKTWMTHQIRLVTLDRIEKIPGNDQEKWVHARAYRFRNVKFPKIIPANPIGIIKAWYPAEPNALLKSDKYLGTFIKRIRTLAPKATSLYQTRGTLILKKHQLDFFLSKCNGSAES